MLAITKHPLVALATLAAAVAATFVDWSSALGSVTSQLNQTAAAVRITADSMRAEVKRLDELRNKQNKTNMEMMEATTLADELKNAYPELADQIDALGTSTGNVTRLLHDMNRAMAEQTKINLQQQIVQAKQAYDDLKQKADDAQVAAQSARDTGLVGGIVGGIKGETYQGNVAAADAASMRAVSAVAAQFNRIAELEALYQKLEDATPAVAGGAAVGPGTSQADYDARNAELQRALHEVQVRGWENPMHREIELLQLAYDQKYELAKKAGQDLTLLAMTEEAEIAQIRKRYADE
ncbi:MAG: hypothetical protein JRJ72_13160, partial [Deltaproteobacteria bacterium]|nr:hypothetical protein [Deltaproteobacteria bacterium]